MAKTLIPKDTNKEMIYYNINSFNNYGITTKQGLFDGEISYDSIDNLGFYWTNSSHYIDITINETCALWCLSGGAYETYNTPLKILKWNGNEFMYSGVIENNRSNEKNVWSKTINNLPKGRYRFQLDTGRRFDSEWYFESLMLYKFLLKQNNQLYTFNNDIIQSPSQELTEDNFKNNGFNNPSNITEEQWNNTFPDRTDVKLLMWTEDITKTEVKAKCNINPVRPIDMLQKQFNTVDILKMKEK